MRRAAPPFVLVLLLGVFVWTGLKGLNFGYHWDEFLAFEEVTRPLENGVFLPGSYNYPSMVFDIGTLALLPRTIPFLVKTAKESTPYFNQPYHEIVPKQRVAPLVAFAKSQEFHLRLRAIFLLITSLTGVWIFLAVRACKRSGWEAAFAAAVVLTSWEIAYHARWVAPDAIQMQFAALWLLFFSLALHSTSRSLVWLRFAAAAAGLACGTKYQGGVLILPVLIYTLVVVRASLPERPLRTAAKEISTKIVIFAVVLFVTSPGLLLQPLTFVQSVRHIGHAYSTGHFGYTVGAVGEHGYRLLSYVTCVLPSHWPVVALFLSAVACFGVVMVWRERPLTAALLLCAPMVFVLFMICYRVMMARNYLLLLPFTAFFAARGAFHIWKALADSVWIRRIVVTCFVGLFASNLIFLCVAAQTIGSGPAAFGQDIVAYLKKHSGEKYFLSPRAEQAMAGANVTLSNVTRDPSAAQRYILHSGDAERTKFTCNRPGQYRHVSGPLEVNLNYYGDWQGAARVVDVSMQRAREMQLLPKP